MDEKQVLTGKGKLIAATMLEKELAEALGLPLGTVKRLRYEGVIPYVQIGRGRVIYLADSIIRWLGRKEFCDQCGEGRKNPVEPLVTAA